MTSTGYTAAAALFAKENKDFIPIYLVVLSVLFSVACNLRFSLLAY